MYKAEILCAKSFAIVIILSEVENVTSSPLTELDALVLHSKIIML